MSLLRRHTAYHACTRHYTINHFINNKAVASPSTFNVVSPRDQSVIHKVSSLNPSIKESALSSSSIAFKSWRTSSLTSRRDILLKAASLLRSRASEFSTMMAKETPASEGFIQFNIETTIGHLLELASTSRIALSGSTTSLGECLTLREPYGVCLAIAPWNAPLILACRAIGTPIVAGNSVILKSSEVSPGTHALFGELFRDAGLPSGVLTILHINADEAPKVVEELIGDVRIRHVNFTGSTKVGRIIAELAGRNLKPSILELGGKAPAIVLADANIECAASHCILGSWMHQGQICMSTERAIIVDEVYDAFIEACVKIGGEAGLRGSLHGQAMRKTAETANALIQDALEKGAKMILSQKGNHENYIAPCIMADITPDMRLYHEESFAPIMSIIRAKDTQEAIEIANDTEYALSSSLFTNDIANAHKIARQLNAAATHINSMTVADDPAIPHGGNRDSGYGRFNSIEGIRSFTQTKVITIHAPSVVPV